MTPKGYVTTSGIIFLLVALAHLVRVLAGWDFTVSRWDVQPWGSVVAAVVAGYLGWMGLRIASRST